MDHFTRCNTKVIILHLPSLYKNLYLVFNCSWFLYMQFECLTIFFNRYINIMISYLLFHHSNSPCQFPIISLAPLRPSHWPFVPVLFFPTFVVRLNVSISSLVFSSSVFPSRHLTLLFLGGWLSQSLYLKDCFAWFILMYGRSLLVIGHPCLAAGMLGEGCGYPREWWWSN